MWPKVTFFAILSVISALIAVLLRNYITVEILSDQIGADSVYNILTILASSMLAVTTFSLSTILSAYNAASQATPRSSSLVMQDSTTQNALASFLGSFVFSLAGIIAINSGIYEGGGKVILFLMTLIVIVLILVTLISWIEHLTKLGSLEETTKLVEAATAAALKQRALSPYMGANPLTHLSVQVKENAIPLYADRIGYVQYIDVAALSALANEHQIMVFIGALPGTFVDPGRPLMRIYGLLEEKWTDALKACFVIDDARAFEEDPRFGLCVMSEIASRALASGGQDPGTVIDVIGRMVRILTEYAENYTESPEIPYERLWMPRLQADDLFTDAFNHISREGAEIFEIQCRLQKAYKSLLTVGNGMFKYSVLKFSDMALERVERSQMLEREKRSIRKIVLQ